MTTVGENALLSEILASVRALGIDVQLIKDTTTRLDERVKTTVDASIDHESRLRRLEDERADYITRMAAWRWVGIGVSLGGIVAALVAALIART